MQKNNFPIYPLDCVLNLPIIHTGAGKVYNIMNKHTCPKEGGANR